tara:strand:+ start:92 stop:337 length:246 start_codon:yes stop_codon:yes gene_type:complete
LSKTNPKKTTSSTSTYREADEKIRRDKTWPSQMEGAVALGWGMGIMQVHLDSILLENICKRYPNIYIYIFIYKDIIFFIVS